MIMVERVVFVPNKGQAEIIKHWLLDIFRHTAL